MYVSTGSAETAICRPASPESTDPRQATDAGLAKEPAFRLIPRAFLVSLRRKARWSAPSMSLPEKAFPVSWDQFHRDARALAWRLAGR